ncbi:MAG: hypothetical protein ACI33N_00685 [Desulfovibrionaceae bacterium]
MGKTIFRAGRHRTITGQAVEFSESDLAAIAAAYDAAVHEAPLVIGHPKTDDPAMGWVAGLKCIGLRLEADFRQMDPAFAEAVEAGRYKHVSAAFYAPDSPHNPKPGGYYLRHVGVLGAVPPAVKGLGPLSFAEDDTLFLAFAENGDVTQPDDTAQNTPNEDPMDKKTDPAAENAALKKELEDMKARMAKQEAERRHADNLAFAEGLVSSGKLAPAGRDVVTATLDALTTPKEDGSLLAFGEGDDAAPLAERFRAFLAAAEPVLMFGEFAGHGNDPAPKVSPLVADARRRAEQAKGRR